MATIKVTGIPPYDGEYELEAERPFNTREWRWIKKISGYMPLTIGEGLAGGDPDLIVALSVIAMNRDGRIQREDAYKVAEDLAEAPFDGAAISFVADEAEDADAGPPVLTSEPDESSPKSSLESQTSSGEPLTNGSEKLDETPSSTGATRSGMSFPGSPPARLVK